MLSQCNLFQIIGPKITCKIGCGYYSETINRKISKVYQNHLFTSYLNTLTYFLQNIIFTSEKIGVTTCPKEWDNLPRDGASCHTPAASTNKYFSILSNKWKNYFTIVLDRGDVLYNQNKICFWLTRSEYFILFFKWILWQLAPPSPIN